ncbi:uncharacterized protein LOC132522698 [Lagenorhynchus albirostris]|uniref:uncharacterized protein LOC132522698 n=1 Tax=Lagenorhynchus albirostris TaxID=27610 RepID=UPI0028F12C39|nr:uncharacterized protein LOC132522698 [Lagenorhynchus albirostris]
MRRPARPAPPRPQPTGSAGREPHQVAVAGSGALDSTRCCPESNTTASELTSLWRDRSCSHAPTRGGTGAAGHQHPSSALGPTPAAGDWTAGRTAARDRPARPTDPRKPTREALAGPTGHCAQSGGSQVRVRRRRDLGVQQRGNWATVAGALIPWAAGLSELTRGPGSAPAPDSCGTPQARQCGIPEQGGPHKDSPGRGSAAWGRPESHRTGVLRREETQRQTYRKMACENGGRDWNDAVQS